MPVITRWAADATDVRSGLRAEVHRHGALPRGQLAGTRSWFAWCPGPVTLAERLLRYRRGTGHAAAARAGDQDHARLDLGPVVQRVTGHRGVHLAVDPGPAAPHRRYRRAEQCLGPAAQVLVGALVQVERERLGVFVRVSDGEP